MKKMTALIMAVFLAVIPVLCAPAESISLTGTWKVKISGIECYISLQENGKCFLSCSGGFFYPNEGTYAVSGSLVTIRTEEINLLAGNWILSGDKLENSVMGYSGEKISEAVRFSLQMDGNSMEDTLQNGDALTVEACEEAELNRFDIAAVHYDGRGNTVFIKRIVGLPGDTVELKDGYLYVNGTRYDEPCINDEYRAGRMNTFGPCVLEDHMFFVLGDHRDKSNDSRSTGPVTAEMMLGKVIEVNGQPYGME